jgi:hypothetical protein
MAMTSNRRRGLGVAAVSCCSMLLSPIPARAQHVHGQATLMIGMEGNSGQVEFRGAGDDLYGFERTPRTAAERAKQSAALDRLRTQGASLIRFDSALGCTVVAKDVRVAEERSGHGEVRAQYTVTCKRPVAGRPIRFGVSALFPGVDRVAVQMVSDTAQTGATISRDRGQVIP